MNTVFLALVFAAELAAWTAIGIGAFTLAGGGWRGWVAAGVAVMVAIVAWGMWASPKSSAPAWLALGTKVVVFGGGVALLAAAGHSWWALWLVVLLAVAHVGVHLASGS